MKNLGRISWFVVLVTVLIMVAEAPAEAYLDPGAGSILLQVLLGGFAAAGVFMKLFWQNLSAPFRRRPSTDKDQAQP